MHINGLRVSGEPTEGRYFLICVIDYRHGDASWYELRERPGITNHGCEELSGWLGSYNDISRTAEGAVEVYRDAARRLRARRIDAEALLAEDNSDLDRPETPAEARERLAAEN